MDPTSKDQLAAAVATLEAVVSDRSVLANVDADLRARLQRACGEIARPDLKDRKRLQKELARREWNDRKSADEALRQSTEIRQLRTHAVFPTPAARQLPPPPTEETGPPPSTEEAEQGRWRAGAALHEPRCCYTCKARYMHLHFFYDQLCPRCGDFNYSKRAPQHDLTGRYAVITGARVKIGYHAAILLLRNGCDVTVTTRFPRDAAARFAREADFDAWKSRVHVYGLDLRHTPSVDALAKHLATSLPRLDFVIHNACQTVRRPPGFYEHLIERELMPWAALPEGERAIVNVDEDFRAATDHEPLPLPASLSQVDPLPETAALPSAAAAAPALSSMFPRGQLDADLQQIDLRTHNSWRLSLAEVPTIELLEVLLVNAAAPFVLTAKLRPLLAANNDGKDRHVVNVSAMEGQFYRAWKTDKHPHTNMAKAALNMLTRTSASDLAKDGIWMNAVDTGWVTDEDPAHLAEMKIQEHQFSPPLDVVDGAARIVDPIFDGLQTGKHARGVFFKDYGPVPW